MARPAIIQLPARPLGVRVAVEATAPAEPGIAEPPGACAAEQADLAGTRQALEEGLAKLETLRAQLVRQAEQQLVDLAVDIARKVLMQEIQAGRYEIDPIVEEALRHVPPRQTVVAHLHPEDWSRCERASEASGGGGNVRFVADPSVPRAACVLETSEGIVQSVVEDHLERIAEDLGGAE